MDIFNFIKLTKEVMERYNGVFEALASEEKKEITLEQWNKPSDCCITCKHFYNEKCYEHKFKVSYEEAKQYTCENHIYSYEEFYGD